MGALSCVGDGRLVFAATSRDSISCNVTGAVPLIPKALALASDN